MPESGTYGSVPGAPSNGRPYGDPRPGPGAHNCPAGGPCERLLKARQRFDRPNQQRLAFRARLILGLADGLSAAEVAERNDTRLATISKWRGRFSKAGLEGLSDAPRSGKPASYDQSTERRILAALDEPAPEGYARWNGALLAKRLQDISKHHIWRVLRSHDISLERRHRWCISTDPQFAKRPPTSSRCTSNRRITRWRCRSTRSRPSRRSSVPRGG